MERQAVWRHQSRDKRRILPMTRHSSFSIASSNMLTAALPSSTSSPHQSEFYVSGWSQFANPRDRKPLFCPVEEGGWTTASHTEIPQWRPRIRKQECEGCGSEPRLSSTGLRCAGPTASWVIFAKLSCLLWEQTWPQLSSSAGVRMVSTCTVLHDS